MSGDKACGCANSVAPSNVRCPPEAMGLRGSVSFLYPRWTVPLKNA